MSKASTVETENREMLKTAVTKRKLTEAQVRLMLLRALDEMSNFQMEYMLQNSLQMSLDEFYL